jgi:hypothetical protein
VTNGDNQYADSFLQSVLEAGDVDLVAFDFYSRFTRPTAPSCDRFSAFAAGRKGCGVGMCASDFVVWLALKGEWGGPMDALLLLAGGMGV